MHDCPRCGQACDCSGDIDDTYVLTEEWVLMNCRCDCEDEEDEDYWEEAEMAYLESQLINDDPTGEEKADLSSYWPEPRRKYIND